MLCRQHLFFVTAEGDTALHAVASNGESVEFLECAKIIFQKADELMFAPNRKGDTPMHCAARAGRSKMVSSLIELAGSRNRLQELLRKENGLKETALHDAVRIGNDSIVKSLLKADRDLANYPKEGTSPLYLAIYLENIDIARILHDMSYGNLSYCGPHGQNALHAATFGGTVIREEVLKWNSSLTTHGDKDGSTPLHFASSFGQYPHGFRQLFEANPSPVYQADNNGLFPIHVAASMGALGIISNILETCPTSAGLCTAQGRTFLHVAVENRRLKVVSFVSQTPSLAWILNSRDHDGNTALHLAVHHGNLLIFCSLYGNKDVHVSLANNSMQTPIDLARSLLSRGLKYKSNNENWIYKTLKYVGATYSCRRADKFERVDPKSFELKPEDMTKEEDTVKDASQILGIGSV
uniref:Uncharacterized protein n=1 Tax=Avena sativa TaxID=4498 RepID=A0ACD5TYD7_AVESA